MKNKITLSMLAVTGAMMLSSVVSAEDFYWTGGSGSSNVTDEANWKDGKVGFSPIIDGNQAYILGNVTVATGKKENWDLSTNKAFYWLYNAPNSYLNVNKGSELTITGGKDKDGIFGGYTNVFLEKGSILNWVCSSSFGTNEVSSYKIDGIMLIYASGDNTWMGAVTTSLGVNGFVNCITGNSNKGTWATYTDVVIDVDLSLDVGSLEVYTRTLASGFTLDGRYSSFAFSTEEGEKLTQVDKAEDLKNVNECYFFDDGMGNLKVQYFRSKSVPEPSTATLSLLALSTLMLRRRRF